MVSGDVKVEVLEVAEAELELFSSLGPIATTQRHRKIS